MNKKVSKKIEEAVKFLSVELSPEKIILFGSRAKNTDKSSSDIDLCVVGLKPDYRSLRIIKEKLNDIFGIYSFDIIFYSDVESDFKKIIDETGKVIYEKGRGYISH